MSVPGQLIITLLLLGPVVPRSSTTTATTTARHVDLGEATLFIPDGARAEDGAIDILLHLHGAPSVLEPAFVEAKRPGVLIEFNRDGLSSAYTRPFADRVLLPRLINATLPNLMDLNAGQEPRLGHLTVSSFSAGFGGVREILKDPENFAKIDSLVMADSLYCGYEADEPRNVINPVLMDGFRRFALEAAAGRKTFILTHSAQVPDGYASTTETADDLIRTVGGSPEKTEVHWADGWTQSRKFRRKGFLVLGFDGAEAADHMRHLGGIAAIWKAIPTGK
jgi:hypothetical protein